MKSVFPISTCCMLLITLFYACSNKSHSVTGTYVHKAETELYTLYDTVQFSPAVSGSTQVYNISLRTSSHFKKKEDQLFNKRTNEILTGQYEPGKQIMNTADPGIVYVFDVKAGTVSLNGIKYLKIE